MEQHVEIMKNKTQIMKEPMSGRTHLPTLQVQQGLICIKYMLKISKETSVWLMQHSQKEGGKKKVPSGSFQSQV